jgi:TonB-linked SusC/RagA family outer membrane protein
MKRTRLMPFALLFLLVLPQAGRAQEAMKVTGRVTDPAGNPLRAANVYLKGSEIVALTNDQGRYELNIPASRLRGEITIVASEIGYATVEVAVTPGATTMTQDFTLAIEPLRLSEIVATGQGTQTTRARLASAVSTVRADEIEKSQEPNIVQALAGKAPGVQVTSSGGDPGAGSYIRIRGAASITGGTQPLFVVDGTPVSNESYSTDPQALGTADPNVSGTVISNRAADLNPEDIDHIEILKGAAATAIYGSRAANGVVLITTKSGRPGATRATLSSSYASDDVTRTVPLQTRYGQGSGGTFSAGNRFSWGPLLSAGTPVYDHATEMYQTGNHWDENLTMSGGSERTTYYLSVGRLAQQGVIEGPQAYNRTAVRLKGSHFLFDDLQITGNFAYSNSDGTFIQQGSNISGIQLGALRTPPDFNNQPYIDPATGIQRTYRDPTPASLTSGHGYDNPFWVAFKEPSTSKVGRTFGNISVAYTPFQWFKLSYVLGNDYASDDRLALFPKGSDAYINGALARNTIIENILDSNLTATATGQLSDKVIGSLTLGQNLNQRNLRRNGVNGTTVINNTDESNFAVTNTGSEFKSRVRTDGYFATGELTLSDQLTLDATGRFDGSSTFGAGAKRRFFYPGLGLAWSFSRLPGLRNLSALSFGKLRTSWGISGLQPPVFSNVSSFNTGSFLDGWVTNGLYSLYNGNEGVFSEPTLGNNSIKPERTREWEAGADLAFFDQRLGLSFTYYNKKTTDAILQVPVPASTGYLFEFENAAEWKGHGLEAQVDVQAIRTPDLAWNISGQWSMQRSCVTNIAGADHLFLNGFEDPSVALVAPDANGACQPFGVLFGSDFIRYGRGSVDQNTGAAIDGSAAAPAGTIYVGADGYPQLDPQSRVLGDPNPRWIGSIRNTFTLFGKLTVSGLIDVVHGQSMWNGTEGALAYFGTPASTAPYHGAGVTETYAKFSGQAVAGPGADKQVPFDEAWFTSNIGSGFTGPASQFVQDAGFAKLRDISVSYTLAAPVIRRLGFNSIDVTVAGRNLQTWTNYVGIDPESNLTGQSIGRGLDYFNNPQTRSFVFTLNLNR